MSLEYSDDNELVYQAKAAAKDIVNAKYEVTKKIGDFLFLAHSEEEFYQRATTVDQILESTSTRRLASVSDSKAKLVKALFQEWEIKHASCDGCNPVNFNLPERVASPVLPQDRKSRKLWDKWSYIGKRRDGSKGAERRFPLEEGNPKTGRPLDANQKREMKLQLLDGAIGGSLGRADDPEVAKQINADSVFWVDPHDLYGRDKRRTADLKGPDSEGRPSDTLDPSHILSMVATPFADPTSGSNGIMRTHHKCTGNTFMGFDAGSNSFKQCSHEHHEGDGCGLTSEVAPEGSTQPGCGQQHIIAKVQTPTFIGLKGEDGVLRTGALPHIGGEKEKDLSGLTPSVRQMQINRSRANGEPGSDDFINSTEEQVGEIPPSRLFLMHPDQAERWHSSLDEAHTRTGGEGRHPANLRTFKIGDKIHRVGDIVSTRRRWGSAEPRVESNLGIVLGASSHRNGEHVRLGRSEGLGPNAGTDSSMASSTPGEYSVIVHRLDSPTTGSREHPLTAVDPGTNQVLPHSVNETTQYYPSSDIETVEPFGGTKSTGKGPKSDSDGGMSKLYGRLKQLQSTFKAKPAPIRTEKPKTVKQDKDMIDLSGIDLSDIDPFL